MQARCLDYRLLRVCAVAAILALGVFFRVTHLGTKVYWHDEVYTSLWLSGYDPSRGTIELFDGREISPADMLRYQHIHPGLGIAQTIRTMARNDPQHPPLYYTLAWLWARWCQDSPIGVRAVAAWFGLLLLPATFWLCLEAFGSRRAAWLGTLFVAVSPIHLLYAQEAREYSLWALMVVVSSAALLHALRLGGGRRWALYGLATLGGLYAHGLFPLVMLAHAAWVAAMALTLEIRGQHRGRRLLAAYLAVSGLAAALFAPWAWTICIHRDSIDACTSWMKESLPWWQHVALCAVPAFVFVTVNPEDSTLWSGALQVGTGVTIVLVVVGVLLSWRYPYRRVWLLSMALIGVPLAVLLTPDLLFGGQRSFSPRFHFPCYVGVTLATVHFLMRWVDSSNRVIRLAGQVAVAFLLTLGISTCATIWNAETWWNKRFGWEDRLQAIRVINQARHPLILSGPVTPEQIGETLTLGHLLHEQCAARDCRPRRP